VHDPYHFTFPPTKPSFQQRQSARDAASNIGGGEVCQGVRHLFRPPCEQAQRSSTQLWTLGHPAQQLSAFDRHCQNFGERGYSRFTRDRLEKRYHAKDFVTSQDGQQEFTTALPADRSFHFAGHDYVQTTAVIAAGGDDVPGREAHSLQLPTPPSQCGWIGLADDSRCNQCPSHIDRPWGRCRGHLADHAVNARQLKENQLATARSGMAG